MVRSRWLLCALAAFTTFVTGCGNGNSCDNGGLLSRFRLSSWRHNRGADCPCETSMPPVGTEGPVFPPHDASVAPPLAPPPRIVPIPHASPIPYTPSSRTLR